MPRIRPDKSHGRRFAPHVAAKAQRILGVRYAGQGVFAWDTMPPLTVRRRDAMAVTTLSELFLKAAGFNKPDCLLYKDAGTYKPVSTAELVDRVRRLAKALDGLGLQRGDRVALMAENGPHWPAVDFATLCSGGVLVPIYPTLLPEQAAYIANDCGAQIVFAETNAHLEGFLSRSADLPQVRHFVLIKGEPATSDPRVTTYAALLEKGAGVDVAAFEAKARQSQPDDLATFVYTSGTTGQPKGGMLTHRTIRT